MQVSKLRAAYEKFVMNECGGNSKIKCRSLDNNAYLAAHLWLLGDGVYGWLKHETGVHQFLFSQKSSPLFVNVTVHPILTVHEFALDMTEFDVAVTPYYRARRVIGGNVVLTHRPTLVGVGCNSSSVDTDTILQTALDLMRTRLYLTQHGHPLPSYEPIRTYHDGKQRTVIDHRSRFIHYDVNKLYQGDLKPLLESLQRPPPHVNPLTWFRNQKPRR